MVQVLPDQMNFAKGCISSQIIFFDHVVAFARLLADVRRMSTTALYGFTYKFGLRNCYRPTTRSQIVSFVRKICAL